ncbi:E3 ubiquitin-protein ligase PRT1-like [Bidens hawaiensis]|uniref:E3 ubiquitin-protein ligase PRT1-like n=1 Tax=Bidens hawaiensis TaxID=980011 RepID=UPI00404A02E0
MEESEEQISDDFTCAVCLDVLYKPIVLVCGHVSCFWCCQHSMRMSSESHCPLCRHPYHHFPAICHTLHFLLKKLYPISYNRRNIQTLEDEKHSTLGNSLDIDSLVTDVGPSSTDVGPSSKSKKLKDNCSTTYKQISVSDVLCAACKQLLFRPVALNCGHVYCESCVTIPAEGMLMCQVCECRHPSGFPKVCRELDRFLEDQFSSEYALKRSIIQQNQERNQKVSTQSPRLSFPMKEDFLKWLTDHGSKYHDGVGCDMCGMCPIFGDRYRCKDCIEICGYDLCGDCYKTGSKLPGRFNQKHTPTHHLELVKPAINRRNVLYRILSAHRPVVSSVVARSESSHDNGSSNLPSPSASSVDQSDSQPLI